ncbi:MAG: hypothetical protein AAF539_03500 [Planctomycetota bacterium]
MALALASLLMVAFITLIRRSTTILNAADQFTQQATMPTMVVEQLRRDVLAATSMGRLPTGFWLRGAIDRNPDTLTTTQRDAAVSYRIVPVADVQQRLKLELETTTNPFWLVRETLRPTSRNDVQIEWEPVMPGAARLLLDSDYADALPEIADVDTWQLDNRDNGGPMMPPSLQIMILGDDGKPLINTTIFHHPED